MRYFLLVLALVTGVAQAGIYKTYDKNGNVIYSDLPGPNAEQVEAKPLMTVPALSRQVINNKLEKTPVAKTVPTSYTVTISKPAPNETIQKGDGIFTTGIKLDPELWIEHHLLVTMDGVQVGKDNFSVDINPEALDRGQHHLEVTVVDQKNKILAQGVSDFFIMQPSQIDKPAAKKP